MVASNKKKISIARNVYSSSHHLGKDVINSYTIALKIWILTIMVSGFTNKYGNWIVAK